VIAIFYAFSREITPAKRRMKDRAPLGIAGLGGFRAIADGVDIVFIAHGIGPARARETVARALDALTDISLIIGTGVAGGLSAGLVPGDLVLADRILEIRGDAVSHAGEPAQEHRADIARHLALAGIKHASGAILTSPRALASREDKRRAKLDSGAIAVDMESAAIAEVATARGIPFAVIRSIIDTADEDLPKWMSLDADGRVRPIRTAARIARDPASILILPRTIRALSRATAAIADAIEAIAHQGHPPSRAKTRGKARAE
jgi:adenosylhomocysteine nucleosidase